MSDVRYDAARAAADLAGEDLLHGVLLHRSGAWSVHGPDVAGGALGGIAFLGATLDSREAADGMLFAGLAGENVDGRDYVGTALRNGASVALTRPWDGEGPDPIPSGDPGGDCAVLLSTDPARALTLLAANWRRRLGTPVVGVTGSNGKTTTKDLLAAILGSDGPTHATGGNFNNELGVPLTLLGLRAEHRWAVVEMGASQAGDIDALAALARPRVGVITNASGAHLEGFGSLDGVIATKGELLDHLPADGAAVLNRDSAGFAAWRDRAPCDVLDWGRGDGPRRWTWSASPDGSGGVVDLDDETFALPLPGRHNGANLVAAVLAARALAGPGLDIAAGLAHLRTSAHRSRVLTVDGVTVLDDTYNANPDSVAAAAAALDDLPGQGRRIAVLGAMAELGDDADELHRDTGRRLAALGLDAVWAVGARADHTASGAVDGGAEGRTFADVEAAAVAMVAELAAGDRVLVKGSRSAGMERAVELFRTRREPDMGHLERA